MITDVLLAWGQGSSCQRHDECSCEKWRIWGKGTNYPSPCFTSFTCMSLLIVKKWKLKGLYALFEKNWQKQPKILQNTSGPFIVGQKIERVVCVLLKKTGKNSQKIRHNPSRSFISLPLLLVREKRLKRLDAFFLQKVPKKAKNVTPTLHRPAYADKKLKGLYAFFWENGLKKAKNPTQILHGLSYAGKKLEGLYTFWAKK